MGVTSILVELDSRGRRALAFWLWRRRCCDVRTVQRPTQRSLPRYQGTPTACVIFNWQQLLQNG